MDRPFLYRVNFPQLALPGRVYIHRLGLESSPYGRLDESINSFLRIYQENKEGFTSNTGSSPNGKDSDFFLATLYRMKGIIYLDVICYGDVPQEKWPGNPDVDPVRCFLYNPAMKYTSPKAYPFTCGDTMIVQGLEEQFRRTTPDLKTFLEAKIEQIPGLNQWVNEDVWPER